MTAQTISNKAILVKKGTEVIVVGIDTATGIRYPTKVLLKQDMFLETDGKPYQVSGTRWANMVGPVVGVIAAAILLTIM